jgi:hypothetical protein
MHLVYLLICTLNDFRKNYKDGTRTCMVGHWHCWTNSKTDEIGDSYATGIVHYYLESPPELEGGN